MADSAPSEEKIWWRVLKRWWFTFGIISLVFLFWLGAASFGLIGRDLFNSGVLIAAVLLYALAFPFSLIFRLDQLTLQWGYDSSITAQLVALLYVGANFTLLGAIHGWWRQFKSGWKKPEKKKAAKVEKREGPTELH